jgi:hypothetical protein
MDAFFLTFIRKWVINVIFISQCVVFLIVDAFWLTFIRKWVINVIFISQCVVFHMVDACLAYFD